MKLHVRECTLPEYIDAYVTNDPRPMGVAYRKGLSEAELRARMMEIHSYFRNPLAHKWPEDEKLLPRELDPAGIDEGTLRAMKDGIITEGALDWIELVRTEASFYGPDPLTIEEVLRPDVPLQAVVAILELLEESGECGDMD